jgi:SAP domain
MALRVTKDTVGVEKIDHDFIVRTTFAKGMVVPAGWEVPEEDVEEVEPEAVGSTLGGYMPHQIRETAEAGAEPSEGYESMTVAELRDLAARRGLDVASDAKKADLVEALREQGDDDTGK